MTPREYEAFSQVHERTLERWAFPVALFANVHKIKYEDGREITLNTLLGRAGKTKRSQSMQEMRGVLLGFKDPKKWMNDEVPDWAKKGARK